MSGEMRIVPRSRRDAALAALGLAGIGALALGARIVLSRAGEIDDAALVSVSSGGLLLTARSAVQDAFARLRSVRSSRPADETGTPA